MRSIKALILRVLNENRIMTIATNRQDGWPQATTVGYVNDGFMLYCFVPRSTQKYANVLRDPRVSIAIGADAQNPMETRGLSLAGTVSEVIDKFEFDYVAKLRLKRYPEYATVQQPSPQDIAEGALSRIMSEPSSTRVALLRVAPEVISVIDHSKGFGHSDLVTFSERDLDIHLGSFRHGWNDIGPLADATDP